MEIRIDKILPNPEQPRSVFDKSELESLAQSLREDGLLNPIAVEGPHEGGMYILVDGECRWRAAKLAGWETIEAHVRPPENGSGSSRLLLAMIGNLRRADMGPIDEALAYRRLRENGMGVEEIARRVGRATSHVHSRMRMLEMPAEVQDLYNRKLLPLDEYTLLAFRRLPEEQLIIIARTAAERGLNTRQIQSICARALRVVENGKNIKVAARTPKVISSDSICPALDFNPGLSKSWSWLRGAAKKTCSDCGLYGDGGVNTICKECPLTLFIGQIANGGYKPDDKER